MEWKLHDLLRAAETGTLLDFTRSLRMASVAAPLGPLPELLPVQPGFEKSFKLMLDTRPSV